MVTKTKKVQLWTLSDTLKNKAQGWLTHYKPKLTKFAQDFATDPTHTLEWSASTFDAAAKVSVAEWVLEVLDGQTHQEQKAKEIVAYLAKEVVQKARWPDKSTSVPSNEMSLCLNAARADLIAEVTQ